MKGEMEKAGQDIHMFKRLQLVLSSLVLSIATADTSALGAGGSPGDDYQYRDCADHSTGIVLLECAKLSVSSSLKDVYVHDQFEEGLLADPDSEFYVLRSSNLPIVVPKNDYQSTSEWVYQDKKYLKLKKGVATLVPGQTTDVIVAIGRLDQLGGALKVTDIGRLEVLQNVVLTFWYTPERGVEAIGVGNSNVYFCARKPCLFGAGK
jgi:hypothetical protein